MSPLVYCHDCLEDLSLITGILQVKEKVDGQWQMRSVQTHRQVWEVTMRKTYPNLSKVACRLLSMHAISAERNWSRWRNVYHDNRKSLAVAKVKVFPLYA